MNETDILAALESWENDPDAFEKLSELAGDESAPTDAVREAGLKLLEAQSEFADFKAASDTDDKDLVKAEEKVDAARTALREALAGNRPLAIHTPPDDLSGPPRPWLLDGWLPSNRVTLVTGGGGRGKSRIILQLCLALASGTQEWLGKPYTAPRPDAEPRPVVFATYEDEPDEVWRRFESIQEMLGPRPTGDRFSLVDMAGRGPLWAPAGGSRHVSTLADITPMGEKLRAVCEERKADLLVLDPLAAVFASNENDRGLVRAFISSWDRWARDSGCAVLMIAHPPKNADDDDAAAYSGSTDWLGGPRSLWALTIYHQLADSRPKKRTGKFVRYLKNPKNSYGPDGGRIWLAQKFPERGGPPVFVESEHPIFEGEEIEEPQEQGDYDGAQKEFDIGS